MPVMDERLSASYTVEIAVVMGIILLILSIIVQTGFTFSARQTGIFNMQTMIEKASHCQEERDALTRPLYQIMINKRQDVMEGRVDGDDWSLEIIKVHFRPEEWLRMLTLMGK